MALANRKEYTFRIIIPRNAIITIEILTAWEQRGKRKHAGVSTRNREEYPT